MIIKVRLFTILEKYGKDKVAEDGLIEVPDDSTLDQLSEMLDLPLKITKIYLVEGLRRDPDYVLSEGAEVKILSFIGGG